MTHFWDNKTGFYFWLCFTFRALLLLSVVMIRLSSVSPPQAPVNTDIYTLEEDKQDTTKRYVITCDPRHHAVLGHIWPDIYHPLTRQPVMHDKENENPQKFRASLKRTLSLNSVVWYERKRRFWKRHASLSLSLFLLAGIVRRKLSCVCPLVAQSRCPNQFPQHFLLSTQH